MTKNNFIYPHLFLIKIKVYSTVSSTEIEAMTTWSLPVTLALPEMLSKLLNLTDSLFT